MAQSFVTMMKNKYSFSQNNGKRVYGPPHGWIGPPPPKGSEIFIGNLPYDVNEEELMPLCEEFGNIYQITLKVYKNKPEQNKGFGFVMFSNSEEANRAIQILNGFQIRPDKPLTAAKSNDNRRLFLSKLPQNKTTKEIIAEIRRHTDGLVKVIPVEFFPGYVFADYESAPAARVALRALKVANFLDKTIQCKFAHPDAVVPGESDENLEDTPALETEHYNSELPGTSTSNTMPGSAVSAPYEAFFPDTDSLTSSSDDENISPGTNPVKGSSISVPVELFFPQTDSLSSSSDEPSSL